MAFSEGIGFIPEPLVKTLAGHPLRHQLLVRAMERLQTNADFELSEAEQVVELYNIKNTADRIEEHFASMRLPLPRFYAIHTAGFPLPFDAEHVLPIFHKEKDRPDRSDPLSDGSFGKPPFELFARPDIPGHPGQVTVGQVLDATYMAFQGRAHPYEWTHDPNGERKVGRILNVIKELIRRQREQGENPIVILSFLSGVYEKSPLKPGDIGILIDDTEKGVNFHPGMGPHAIMETYLGSRFQPKIGRAAQMDLATAFMAMAEDMDISTGPANIIGTQTTTEYQSLQEIGEAVAGFERAKKLGLSDLAFSIIPVRGTVDAFRTIFLRRWREPSLLFGMGNTFELATLRQTQTRVADGQTWSETDIPVLPLALITDSVGKNSIYTDHGAIVQAAFDTAERNAALLKTFAQELASGNIPYPEPVCVPAGVTSFSLRAQMHP